MEKNDTVMMPLYPEKKIFHSPCFFDVGWDGVVVKISVVIEIDSDWDVKGSWDVGWDWVDDRISVISDVDGISDVEGAWVIPEEKPEEKQNDLETQAILSITLVFSYTI